MLWVQLFCVLVGSGSMIFRSYLQMHSYLGLFHVLDKLQLSHLSDATHHLEVWFVSDTVNHLSYDSC